MRVLVTRSLESAARTAARLRAMGHEVVLSPVIDIVATGADLPDAVFDAVIATSANAFIGLDQVPPALRVAPLLVVGEQTAARAETLGLGKPEIVAPDVGGLIAAIAQDFPEPFRFLYFAGRDRKPDLEHALLARGHCVTLVETYAAHSANRLGEEARAALRDDCLDAALHFSARSAAIFRDLVRAANDDNPAKALRHVAISSDAARPLLDAGWTVRIAATPDEDAMLTALAKSP